jgi:hypothetical protein
MCAKTCFTFLTIRTLLSFLHHQVATIRETLYLPSALVWPGLAPNALTSATIWDKVGDLYYHAPTDVLYVLLDNLNIVTLIDLATNAQVAWHALPGTATQWEGFRYFFSRPLSSLPPALTNQRHSFGISTHCHPRPQRYTNQCLVRVAAIFCCLFVFFTPPDSLVRPSSLVCMRPSHLYNPICSAPSVLAPIYSPPSILAPICPPTIPMAA